MTPITARWLPYGLPFHRPWESARGRIDGRRGYLLRLEASDGRVGWGDCAPLPEAGIDDEAATRYAEECASQDLAAQAAAVPLSAWLAGKPTPGTIPVNAALGSLAALHPNDIATACTAGFEVLKIKVGLAPPAVEIARLAALCEGLPPTVRLRLDANGAWDAETATDFLARAAGLPVESLEEPLCKPDPQVLAELQRSTAVSIALDESLPRLSTEALLAERPVRRLVLKPARHGGLAATLALARRARASGMECVLTSALESACGLLAVAHLAAALEADGGPELAHGLATAGWFAADTGRPPPLLGARLQLPQGPGLGFVPALS